MKHIVQKLTIIAFSGLFIIGCTTNEVKKQTEPKYVIPVTKAEQPEIIPLKQVKSTAALNTEELNTLFERGQKFSATFIADGKPPIGIVILEKEIAMSVGGGRTVYRLFEIENGLFKKQKSPDLEIFLDPTKANTFWGREPGSVKNNLKLVIK